MDEIATLITGSLANATTSLVTAGDWLTGEQRRDAALQARDARTNELDQRRKQALSPFSIEAQHPATDHLSAEAVDVVHRIASDPGRLTRDWAESMMASIGEETYVELVGIAACTAAMDTFWFALGEPEPKLGDASSGSPTQARPNDVGEVGAWVSQTVDGAMANVSRALSLVPVTNQAWVGLVQAMYSRGPGFLDLEWERALSRPQVELVAARTTAEMECFY